MLDILKNGFKNITRKKMRSVLTILGISIGIMSVVIISTIGKIGTQTIKTELESMGIGGIVMTTDVLSTQTFTIEDIENIKTLTQITDATPFITKYSSVKVKEKTNSCMIWGIDSSSENIVNMELLYGRMINKSDVNSMQKVCLVEESFATEHYKRSNIVGKKISILISEYYQEYEVVGVIKSGGNIMQNIVSNVAPGFVYVPYTTMDITDVTDGFNQIVAKTADNTDIDKLSDEIENDFKQNRNLKVSISNLNSQIDNLNSILNIVTVILTLIAGISLVVAGLSIMTVMLVSVNERTVEIGIKKAIGASKKIILLEFLSESMAISLVGAVVGILGGVIISVIGCIILGIDVIINTQMIILSLFFAVFIGTIFGIYPAIKASNLRPVDAIRS